MYSLPILKTGQRHYSLAANKLRIVVLFVLPLILIAKRFFSKRLKNQEFSKFEFNDDVKEVVPRLSLSTT